MLKFNPENYPPKKPGDVEFTEHFVLKHRALDAHQTGRLVANTLLENMLPEDQHNAPEILVDLIENFPESQTFPGGIYYGFAGRAIEHRAFISGIEEELGHEYISA